MATLLASPRSDSSRRQSASSPRNARSLLALRAALLKPSSIVVLLANADYRRAARPEPGCNPRRTCEHRVNRLRPRAGALQCPQNRHGLHDPMPDLKETAPAAPLPADADGLLKLAAQSMFDTF